MKPIILFLALLCGAVADKEMESPHLRGRGLEPAGELCIDIDGLGEVTVNLDKDDDNGNYQWYIDHGAMVHACETNNRRALRSEDTLCKRTNGRYYEIKADTSDRSKLEEEGWKKGSCQNVYGEDPDRNSRTNRSEGTFCKLTNGQYSEMKADISDRTRLAKEGWKKGSCQNIYGKAADRNSRTNRSEGMFCKRTNGRYYEMKADISDRSRLAKEGWKKGSCQSVYGEAPDSYTRTRARVSDKRKKARRRWYSDRRNDRRPRRDRDRASDKRARKRAQRRYYDRTSKDRASDKRARKRAQRRYYDRTSKDRASDKRARKRAQRRYYDRTSRYVDRTSRRRPLNYRGYDRWDMDDIDRTYRTGRRYSRYGARAAHRYIDRAYRRGRNYIRGGAREVDRFADRARYYTDRVADDFDEFNRRGRRYSSYYWP